MKIGLLIPESTTQPCENGCLISSEAREESENNMLDDVIVMSSGLGLRLYIFN